MSSRYCSLIQYTFCPRKRRKEHYDNFTKYKHFDSHKTEAYWSQLIKFRSHMSWYCKINARYGLTICEIIGKIFCLLCYKQRFVWLSHLESNAGIPVKHNRIYGTDLTESKCQPFPEIKTAYYTDWTTINNKYLTDTNETSFNRVLYAFWYGNRENTVIWNVWRECYDECRMPTGVVNTLRAPSLTSESAYSAATCYFDGTTLSFHFALTARVFRVFCIPNINILLYLV